MVAHIHAELMALYAQDALETDRPWERWQWMFSERIEWIDCNRQPEWDARCLYRRKPRTININGFEVPEPLREAPEHGSDCWFASITFEGPVKIAWKGFAGDRLWLKRGLLHATEEAAQIHIDALLSFTRVDK